jgi:hypothetical protein
MITDRTSTKLYIPHPVEGNYSIIGILNQLAPQQPTRGRKIALVCYHAPPPAHERLHEFRDKLVNFRSYTAHSGMDIYPSSVYNVFFSVHGYGVPGTRTICSSNDSRTDYRSILFDSTFGLS